MDKKHLFFVAALAVVLLLTRNSAVAQDSVSQPTRQDTAPNRFANGGNFQAPSDEDIQLLRKDLRSQKKQIVAANMNLTDVEAERSGRFTTSTPPTWPGSTTQRLRRSRSTCRPST